MVIADPRYTIDLSCKVENPYKYLQPLPFSKVEAEIVSEQLKTTPFIKEKATKYTLDGSDSQIVHIATHGELLEIQENEEETVFPLSRCSMYFAGANDFFLQGKRISWSWKWNSYSRRIIEIYNSWYQNVRFIYMFFGKWSSGLFARNIRV